MNNSRENIKNKISKTWDLDKIKISHSDVNYKSFGKSLTKNETEFVRLHFGLRGSYEFKFFQLNSSFKLNGHHNNIMYSKGLEIEVENLSNRIETFGINIDTDYFIEIGQNGNDLLKRFTEKVINKENTILSKCWKVNNFKIQQVINDILTSSYNNDLKNLFLLSKSIELLVLQAELYEGSTSYEFVRTEKDKKRLVEAKELLVSRIENPPTIAELSELSGINEYKLKRGFKELFGTTVFGYIHDYRLNLAKRLLLDTNKLAKEIAYEAGYSSPQHFSSDFKKKFGVTPNCIRENPNSIT